MIVIPFDLKKNDWFFKVETLEKSFAVQKWLFGQGIVWHRGGEQFVTDGRCKIIANFALMKTGNGSTIFHYPDQLSFNRTHNDNIRELKFKFATYVSEIVDITNLEHDILDLTAQINLLSGKLKKLKDI